MSFVKSKPHNPTKNHNNWLRALRALADSCKLMMYVLPAYWLRALRALADSCKLMMYVLPAYWLRALRALADCLLVKVVPCFGTSMLFGSGSKSASNKYSWVQKSLNTKKRGQTLIYLGIWLYCKKRTQSAPLIYIGILAAKRAL